MTIPAHEPERLVTVEKHYDLLTSEGDDPVHDPPKLREYMDRYDGPAFFEQLGSVTGVRVLEIGIGTGRLAIKALKQRPELLVGLDVSRNALAKCRRNIGDSKRLVLQQATFPEWDSDATFDVIYSSQTFMHIAELEDSFGRIRQLLSANGHVLISFANCDRIVDFGDRVLRLYRHDPEEIESAATNSGLTSSIATLRDGDGVVAWLWAGAKSGGAVLERAREGDEDDMGA